jgi:hypothetical protein
MVTPPFFHKTFARSTFAWFFPSHQGFADNKLRCFLRGSGFYFNRLGGRALVANYVYAIAHG